MRLFRPVRWLLLALLVSLIPASSYAGVFISVGFAPPALPVYDQPPCPEPGYMWIPGYWAYGDDGYYWVPGAWVPAPYDGALWTPGYWGWSDGLYVYHEGYWGPEVGYYGGVNYGFGYGGIGFAGGVWRGGVFAYNTAVMHVGVGGGWGGRVYADPGAVERGFVARDSHVAFSGGPGGIHHDPSPGERLADRDQHQGPSSYQVQHVAAARSDHSSYARSNGGHPGTLAVSRSLGAGSQSSHGAAGGYGASAGHSGSVGNAGAGSHGGQTGYAGAGRATPQSQNGSAGRSGAQPQGMTQSRGGEPGRSQNAAPSSQHSAPSGGSHAGPSGGGQHAAPASKSAPAAKSRPEDQKR
jgi:hypothetical protein